MPSTTVKYLCALATICLPPIAQADQEPLWLRNAALSPDGSKIAFTYQSQIYIAPSIGGEARALTSGSFYPHALTWSPDNSTLAFAANPYGNDDVFTLSLTTLVMKRLTYHSGDDIPTAFSADGQQVLFSTTRLTDADQDFYSRASKHSFGTPGSQLYAVNLADNAMQSILPIPARHANWNLQQSRLLYNSPHKDQPYRKHQASFAVPSVWMFDAKTQKHRQLTPDKVAAQMPLWDHKRQGFYFLSEQSGDFNVWYYNLATNEQSQLTHFTRHPVRDLTVASNGDIAFSFNGELYRLAKGQSKPQKINLDIAHFAPSKDRFFVSSEATQFVPSQHDDEVLFASYGDIFAMDTNKEKVSRLTTTAGAEKDMVYTPDGYGVLYSALRDGHWGLYLASSNKKEELLSAAPMVSETPFMVLAGQDITQPQFSPDGTQLAFVVDGRSLHVIDVDNDESKGDNSGKLLPPKLVSSKSATKAGAVQSVGKTLITPDKVSESGTLNFAWSPDSTQLAVHVMPAPYSHDILVVDAKGNKPAINVSQNGFYNTLPKWSADNRILSWMTTDGGLKDTAGEDSQYLLRGVFTNGRAQTDYKNDVAVESGDEENATPTMDYPLTARNLEYRQAFEFPYSGNIIDFAMYGDQLFVIDALATPEGDEVTRGFVYDIRKQQTEFLFTDLPSAQGATILPKQGLAFVHIDGEVVKVDLESSDQTPIVINLPVEYQQAPRKLAAYQQMVKQTQELFYRQDMGKVDWNYYSKHYQRYLPHINNDRDFGDLISELYGELNASHTGGYGVTEDGLTRDETASLGLIFKQQRAQVSAKAPQPGLIIDGIMPGSPADIDEQALQVGDRLTAINGKPVKNLSDVARLLNHKADEAVSLTLKRKGKAITQRVTPVDADSMLQLVQKRWELERRNYVTAKTDGQIAYVYLPNMSNESFQHLRSEALGRFRHAKALILDIRFNGGGFLADTLIEFLTAQEVADVVPHTGESASDASRRSWMKPSLVIANSASYSEASAFSQYYQDLNVGPIIGEPVPGTGTAVTGFHAEVYEGVRYRFPYLPLKNLKGQYYENLELQPDVVVFNTPEKVVKGKDTQLDAAIEEALSLINKS
ncbi:Tricorn protease [Photobacterium jeanii]|uniref:Tricorn protease homolog n=1 Tax=Photobacterium jeanii TaxID=858640 RepID=A0A178K2T0_9GAMM|nr:S41 family peptidase [Photobacterium jeanii]OAN11022.1 Tricorn protease [Photobacterium jeanii]PST90536.1 PDZ domain-containing protein [Photobacterium jeanii]